MARRPDITTDRIVLVQSGTMLGCGGEYSPRCIRPAAQPEDIVPVPGVAVFERIPDPPYPPGGAEGCIYPRAQEFSLVAGQVMVGTVEELVADFRKKLISCFAAAFQPGLAEGHPVAEEFHWGWLEKSQAVLDREVPRTGKAAEVPFLAPDAPQAAAFQRAREAYERAHPAPDEPKTTG